MQTFVAREIVRAMGSIPTVVIMSQVRTVFNFPVKQHDLTAWILAGQLLQEAHARGSRSGVSVSL